MRPLSSTTWNQTIVIGTSILTFMLGLAALVGKQIPSLPIVNLGPEYFAMVYDTAFDTAFSFYIAGIGLLTTFFQWRTITRVLAGILITMGCLTFLQHALTLGWGPIEKVFFLSNIDPAYLPNMPLINAICFMCLGWVFWCLVKYKTSGRHAILFASWIGVLLPAVAILSLFGYLIPMQNVYTDNWGIFMPMSTNVSVGFILLGVGITSITADFSQRAGLDLKRSLPILITVFASLISLLFWRFLITQGSFQNLSPDLMMVTMIKELGIAVVMGIAVYFLQRARQHAKNAEGLFLMAKETKTQLLHQATHDQLTGLANRFLFIDHIGQATAHAERHKNIVALLFFDLDRFKFINDSLGHAVGDTLLKTVTDRLKKLTRDEDTLARLGGDEFVLLVADVSDEKDLRPIVEKYLSAFMTPFYIDDHELHLDCSIGISMYPKDGTDASTLLKSADIAMYRAKKNKLRFQFYTAEMQRHVMARLAMENELYLALKKNKFVLYYQPIVDLRSGKISAVEALIRWQDPIRGLMNPGEFIPVAEEMGLIVEIGEWILRTACAQNRDWQLRGLLTTRMSVNIAEKQVKQPNFSYLVDRVLKDYLLEPQFLALELTENALIDNSAPILQALKSLGVQLAIDDFGIQYSSLNRLRHFPVDKLKIDQSFLKDIPENPDDRAIVLAIIAMAKNLNLGVIAEGVETREQIEFLLANGCYEMQGFYFSKPLDADEFEASMPKFKRLMAPFVQDAVAL